MLAPEFTQKDVKELILKVSQFLKINPQELDWNQFVKGLPEVGVKPENWISLRIKKLGGFHNIKNSEFGVGLVPSSLVAKRKSQQEKKKAEISAGNYLLFDSLANVLISTFAKPIYKIPRIPKRTKHLERSVHSIISDTHFGSDLLPDTGTRRYTVNEEAASVAALVSGLLDFKTSYRKTSKLHVSLMGDIIAGIIHSPEAYAPLSEQIARAIHVLGRAMWILASEYPEVEVNCATGNHDRRPDKHRDRATTDKWDSYSTVIYYAIKQQMLNVPNFKMNIPKTPYFIYDTFGYKIWGSHGDTVIQVPNLGPINTKSLEHQINAMNANQEHKIVGLLFGHSHSAATLTLSNGVTVVVNPPLIPSDQYAQSIGIGPDSPTGQQAWESVPGFPFGDRRTIWISESDRQNKNNLKIIPPFSGF
jgi:hypothetical protein